MLVAQLKFRAKNKESKKNIWENTFKSCFNHLIKWMYNGSEQMLFYASGCPVMQVLVRAG